MSDQSDRLKIAIAETKLSMREMAERWGWSYNTLKSNANGNMPFSFAKAMVYAARLKVRAEWLYAGEGEMRPANKTERRPLLEVPVIGWVQAGALADVTVLHTLDDLDTTVADGLPPGRWFATDVRGDSMDRISPEGSRIFVNSEERMLSPGGFYLFSLRGETTFKRYYDEPVPRLEPYSWNAANRPIFLTKDTGWEVVGRVHRTILDI